MTDLAATLADLGQSLSGAADKILTYLGTAEGKADANRGDLEARALTLLTEADDVANVQLDVATQDGPQAVTTLQSATAKLKAALQVREDIAKDLAIVDHISSLATAVLAKNLSGITSSGSALLKDFS